MAGKSEKNCYSKNYIKDWHLDDRPREKLLKNGVYLLSNTYFEIARKFNDVEEKKARPKIKYSDDVVSLFKSRMRNLKNEVFKIILLDARNSIIENIEISKGTPTGAYPIIREIVSRSLQKFASGIICVHNHPSGEPEPSKEDETFTRTLKDVLKLVDIRLLDRIIFGKKEFYSFDKKMVEKY